MATVTTIVREDPAPVFGAPAPRAMSWSAILAGATAAAALSLILLVLGMGLGLSAVSPWASASDSAEAIGWGAIIWIVFAAFASSGLGGYIAGRLRERWPGVHADEVHFRDTAHGFLAWAVATIVTAATLTSVIGAVLGAAAPAATAAGAALATNPVSSQQQSAGNSLAYAVDSLFRAPAAAPGVQPAASTPAADDARSRAEVGRIFDASETAGTLTAEDARYVGQVLTQYRGYAQPDAEQRVRDTFNASMARREAAEKKAREIAEQARRNAAQASLWIFVSLLLGAFTASLMATFGGRRRDLP